MNTRRLLALMQITMHKDNLHIGDVEHRDVHNLNGALVHMATVQGLEERGRAIFGSDGDRPFVLSRSFFAGSQRSGPIWTGDNAATWEHLRLSVPMLLSISVAGLPFAGMLSHSAVHPMLVFLMRIRHCFDTDFIKSEYCVHHSIASCCHTGVQSHCCRLSALQACFCWFVCWSLTNVAGLYVVVCSLLCYQLVCRCTVCQCCRLVLCWCAVIEGQC